MKRIVQLLLILIITAAAAGQNYCNNPVPPCDPNDPRSACYRPPEPPPECEPYECDKCTKSPCYAASGVYVSRVRDLRIPTTGFPIEVGRLYQSNHAIDGESGYGWVSSLSARLHYAVYLKSAPSTYQKEAVIRMTDGALYRFVDNGNGTFTAPEGRFDTLVRNGEGSFDMQLQRSRAFYHFDDNGRLRTRTDEFGNVQTWTYTGDRLQRVADSAGSGRYVDVTWGADGRISDVTDFTGRNVHYTYNTQGMLTGVRNPLNQTIAYSYTAGKWSQVLSTVTDHWGRNITTITWDAQARVKSYTERGETFTYTYGYNNHPSVTAKTDSVGNTWQYVYNSDGLVTESAPPGTTPSLLTTGTGGVSTEATATTGTLSSYFRTNGLRERQTDQVGVITSATYNAQGNALTATYDDEGPNAVRYEYAYDANFPEKLIGIKPVTPSSGLAHPDWQGVRYEYHPPGSTTPGALHRVSRVDADGATVHVVITIVYDAQGRVTSFVDEGGATTDLTYDAYGNLQTRTEPANNDGGARPVTTYAYDTLGRLTSTTNPLGRVRTYTYDLLDLIKTVTLPKPVPSSTLTFTTTYHYDEFDSSSQLLFTRMVDANGRASRVGRDQYGQSIQSISPANDVVRHEFTCGLLTGEWDANNNKTTYAYDTLRRRTTMTYADGTYIAYTYNADGTIASMRDRAGQTMTATYDAFKRVVARGFPGGGSVAYTYQGTKLQQIVDTYASPSETHTFTYDNSFRLIANAQGARGSMTFTYDSANRVASRAVASGATTTVGYYPNGLVRTLTWSPVSGTFKFDYTLTGRTDLITFPNGQTRDYTFDDQGRLTELANRHPSTGDVAVFGYGYDIDPATGQATLLGQRTSVTTTIPSFSLANAVTNFAYDSRYFVNGAAYPSAAPFNGLVESWTYDGDGNRVSATVNGTTANYSYYKHAGNTLNGLRLQSDGTSTYAFDAKGNVTSRGADTFTYDHKNLLRTVAGSVSASYTYDYNGRRSAKSVGGTSSEYLYDDYHAVVETTGGVKSEYLFAPGLDQVLAMVRGGAIHYFGVDALDSVVAINDTAGAVQRSYLWGAWGQSIAQSGTLANPLGYTAREAGEAGLHFYRARFYEPSTGRFLSEDPEGFVGALNSYLYVQADPLRHTDPLGRHLQVCFYPDAAAGFGHVGFRTGSGGQDGGGPTDGFSPDGVKPDRYPRRQCKWLPTTPDQDRCMNDCKAQRQAETSVNYSVLTRNCTDFVRDCMIQCGIPVPEIDGPRPRPFFEGLTLPDRR